MDISFAFDDTSTSYDQVYLKCSVLGASRTVRWSGGAGRFWSRMLERPVDQGATAAYATIGFADEGPS
jgi:hypothetical protein